MRKIIAIMLVALLLAGCGARQVDSAPGEGGVRGDSLPLRIAELSLMNITEVTTYEQYVQFTATMNGLIDALNKESDLFDIPRLNDSETGWAKAQGAVQAFTPFIENYNDVVDAAQGYKMNRTTSQRDLFYLSAGSFVMEIALIGGAVVGSGAVWVVGAGYGAIKLGALAARCPECARKIADRAPKTAGTVLGEGWNQLKEQIGDAIGIGDDAETD